MSRFRRRLLLMMQKLQEIWRDVVLTGTGIIVATDTTEGQQAKIFPQGWTKQDQYEGKNLFDASKEINTLYDGSIGEETNKYIGNNSIETTSLNTKGTACGKQLGFLYGKTLTLSLIAKKVSVVAVIYSNGELKTQKNFTVNTSSYISFDVDSENFVVTFAKANVSTGNAIAENIMLNEGSTALPYEPYTGNQPSPSPEYPQPITNSGTYNDDTGKYEYTLTASDAEENPTNTQTVTLTSDRPLTRWDRLVYMDGQWQWEYGSMVYKFTGDETFSISRNDLYFPISGMKSQLLGYGICDKYKVFQSVPANTFVYITVGNNNRNVFFRKVLLNYDSIDDFKNAISQQKPVLYVEADEVVYVALPESEQQALNALKTYYPTTVFSNDQEGFMQVEYRTKYGGDA